MPGPKEKFPVSILGSLLRYEPDTGKLFWLPRDADLFSGWGGGGAEVAAKRWNLRYAGTEAFTAKSARGYHKGSIFDADYRAHRVIWALVTGDWPEQTVDHINGNPSDNRWVNLRAATFAENSQNKKSASGGTSKYHGVTKEKACKKWRAQIVPKGMFVHLGLFDKEEDAARAYDTAAKLHFGAFARLNFGEVT